jgi:hypothetical protein
MAIQETPRLRDMADSSLSAPELIAAEADVCSAGAVAVRFRPIADIEHLSAWRLNRLFNRG